MVIETSTTSVCKSWLNVAPRASALFHEESKFLTDVARENIAHVARKKMKDMLWNRLIDRLLVRNTRVYWNKVYKQEIEEGKVRIDQSLIKLLPLLQDKRRILDFGSGPGGNVKLLSRHLTNVSFHLVDISTEAIAFARNKYLGLSDDLYFCIFNC